ncbi:MAG: DUF3604 domain-containing protein [Acidobacteriota bacterium]
MDPKKSSESQELTPGSCTRRSFLRGATVAATSTAAALRTSTSVADSEKPRDGKVFWGDIHTHTGLSDGNGSHEDNFEIAKSHLDFWAMADHAFGEGVFSLDYRKFGKPGRKLINEVWEHHQELCRSYEAPGRFIPILAYEWTNFLYGHHNVYYRDYDQPIRMPVTLPELYKALKGVEAFVIPHHTGYPKGVCGKDWDYHDEWFSPFVEIYSTHGSSETEEGVHPVLTTGSWMGPGAADGCVQAGLARGYKLGIMASSDSHLDHPGPYDCGLAGVHATELTRAALWEAFRQRRIYGVTGDRIFLDFRLNGKPMGSILPQSRDRRLSISAVAWSPIDRVEVLKNNQVFHTFSQPAGVPSLGKKRFRFFIEWGWDARAEHEWSGTMEVTGGKVLQAIPGYRGTAQSRVGTGISSLAGGRCSWTARTEKAKYDGQCRRYADLAAFEIECENDARIVVTMTCDQLRQTLTLSPNDLLEKPRVQFMENIPVTNDGNYWRSMQVCSKFKIHRAWPTDHLTVNLSLNDKSRGQGTDFYYIRLTQQNGQRAWSSPIWVGEHSS